MLVEAVVRLAGLNLPVEPVPALFGVPCNPTVLVDLLEQSKGWEGCRGREGLSDEVDDEDGLVGEEEREVDAVVAAVLRLLGVPGRVLMAVSSAKTKGEGARETRRPERAKGTRCRPISPGGRPARALTSAMTPRVVSCPYCTRRTQLARADSRDELGAGERSSHKLCRPVTDCEPVQSDWPWSVAPLNTPCEAPITSQPLQYPLLTIAEHAIACFNPLLLIW